MKFYANLFFLYFFLNLTQFEKNASETSYVFRCFWLIKISTINMIIMIIFNMIIINIINSKYVFHGLISLHVNLYRFVELMISNSYPVTQYDDWRQSIREHVENSISSKVGQRLDTPPEERMRRNKIQQQLAQRKIDLNKSKVKLFSGYFHCFIFF